MKETSNFPVPTDLQNVKMEINLDKEICFPLIPPTNTTATWFNQLTLNYWEVYAFLTNYMAMESIKMVPYRDAQKCLVKNTIKLKLPS